MRSFLKVGHRIAIGYVLLLTLLAVIGGLGFSSVNFATETADALYLHPFTVTNSLSDARRDLLQINGRLLFALTYPDDPAHDDLASELTRLEQSANQSLTLARDRYLGPHQDFQLLALAWADWLGLANSVTLALNRGETDAARALYRSQAVPQFQQTLAAFETMLSFARSKAASFHDSGQQARDHQRRDAQTLMAMAVILGGGAFLLILRSIITPLGRLRRSLNALTHGRLDSPTSGIQRKDEIGDVARELEDLRLVLLAKQRGDLKFRTVFHNSPDLIIISRKADGVFIEINDGFERIMGYRREEVIGRSSLDLHAWASRQHRADAIAAMAGQTRLVDFETQLRRKDGDLLTVLMSAERVLLDGEDCLIVVARDITQRKLEEETMRHMLDELARSNTELARVAHVAAHDLQEPSRAICSYAQLLDRRYGDMMDREGRDCLGFLVAGAYRMRDLVSGLLSYSRAGTTTGGFTATALDEILATVQSDLHSVITERQARIITDGPLPVVRGDGVQLHQLLLNLFSNALKFQPPGQAPEIRLTAQPELGFWHLTVSDNGIGIPAESHKAVFEMFRRLHGPGTYPGTGLGLALAKRIVENHDGRIWLESKPGQGVQVHFTLPAPLDAEPVNPPPQLAQI